MLPVFDKEGTITATTKMILNKSGVNPGQGASDIVNMEPSINDFIS